MNTYIRLYSDLRRNNLLEGSMSTLYFILAYPCETTTCCKTVAKDDTDKVHTLRNSQSREGEKGRLSNQKLTSV